MTHSYYESTLGRISINTPILSPEEKATVPLGLGSSAKFIIEEDFTNRIPDYPTNESLRDLLNEEINVEVDTLYLDANEERLKLWTSSYQGILRAATYLNLLLDYTITAEDMEDFRRENKTFSFKKYREFITEDDDVVFTYLMAGILDFSIWLKDGTLQHFMVSSDLTELFSAYTGHDDIEEVLDLNLYKSPYYEEIILQSETECFIAYAKSKEALIELVTTLNQMADVFFMDEDRELLSESIDVMLSNN